MGKTRKTFDGQGSNKSGSAYTNSNHSGYASGQQYVTASPLNYVAEEVEEESFLAGNAYTLTESPYAGLGSEGYEAGALSFSTSLEREEVKAASEELQDEIDSAVAVEAYAAYRAQKHRKAVEAVEADSAGKDEAPQGYTPTENPYATLSPYSYDFDEQQDREISFSSTMASRSFDTAEAVAWYKEQHDEGLQAARANSLMGWEKDEDGGWRQTGEAPQSLGRTQEMHGKHTDYKNEHLVASFRDADRGARPRAKFAASQDLAESEGKTVVGHNTRYLNDEEQAQAAVGMKDGKLLGADGKRVDTTGASGKGTFFEGGAGRFIFNKDEDGTLRAAGAWEGHTETKRSEWFEQTYGEKELLPSGEDDIQMSFMNHSSLIAGRDSRGAGELLVEDGDVKMVTDNSGHYRTDGERLYDVVSGLANDGAATEGMAVAMVNKDIDDKLARLKEIKKAGDETQGRGAKLGDLVVGANEFLSYGGAADAEQRMRSAREARSPMMDAIQGFDRSSLKKTETNDRSAANTEGKGGRVELLLEQLEGKLDRGPAAAEEERVAETSNVSRLRAMFENA
ncbi:MAG: hypothetical protein EP330_24015 [Deltaproteobacteria bacterium]|nr:MAG: hypothetical protein EP330_24015 [Deltaproteobacteria bacterium]